MDLAESPYPTRLGIDGTHVTVDWEACVADGVCMDVCPVDVTESFLNPGTKGTDKSDPVREADCIGRMACEAAYPTKAIKISV